MIDQTREHLRLLSLFHYVVGGIGYVFSLFPVFHLVLGILFLTMPEKFGPPAVTGQPSAEASETTPGEGDARRAPAPSPEEFPSRLFGLLFTIIPAVIILAGFALSTMIVLAGRRLAQLRSHTFCLAMAGVECILMPFGTVLGVFTLITLTKPEARRLFGLPETANQPPEPAPMQ